LDIFTNERKMQGRICSMITHHNTLNKAWFIKTRNSPNSTQGMRHREQCAMSKELAGYGMRWVAMMPSIAGTPRSNANWTCASWLSLGASDIVKIPRSNRYPPQLATCTIARPQHQAIPSPQKPETGGSPGSCWSITKQKKKRKKNPWRTKAITYPTPSIQSSSNWAIFHAWNE